MLLSTWKARGWKGKKERRLGCISNDAVVSSSASVVQADSHDECLKRCGKWIVMEAEVMLVSIWNHTNIAQDHQFRSFKFLKYFSLSQDHNIISMP